VDGEDEDVGAHAALGAVLVAASVPLESAQPTEDEVRVALLRPALKVGRGLDLDAGAVGSEDDVVVPGLAHGLCGANSSGNEELSEYAAGRVGAQITAMVRLPAGLDAPTSSGLEHTFAFSPDGFEAGAGQ